MKPDSQYIFKKQSYTMLCHARSNMHLADAELQSRCFSSNAAQDLPSLIYPFSMPINKIIFSNWSYIGNHAGLPHSTLD
ncbi:hypothetical protein EUGRSUZ_A02120 [Eucalyptus grandis]|uniref:Uncharacterized protein n=2 Tax=Eucalyptus grandis TaxID=71139 RepID=A0ACC3M5A8_EUCGR|nr:hypothetical protein EUGRSUZ_A02120 [Eucalyptus grandis]